MAPQPDRNNLRIWYTGDPVEHRSGSGAGVSIRQFVSSKQPKDPDASASVSGVCLRGWDSVSTAWLRRPPAFTVERN